MFAQGPINIKDGLVSNGKGSDAWRPHKKQMNTPLLAHLPEFSSYLHGKKDHISQ